MGKLRKNKLKTKWPFLIFLLLLFFVLQSSAADLQSGHGVRKQFVLQLPEHWRIETFQIEESVDYGSADESIVKQRFTSEIVLLKDTYELDKKDDTVSLLVPVAQAGEKRIVHGIATSVKKGGVWRTQIGLESDPTTGLGQTLNSFSGNVIVRGTLEEVGYQQKIKATRQMFIEQQARERLVHDLPSYWQLNEFSLSEDVFQHIQDKGTEKNIEQRFTAIVELMHDTFKAKEQLGEVTILLPIAMTGEKRLIHGGIRASFEESNQSIILEQKYGINVTKYRGKPKDFFQGQVLIERTPKLEKYHEHWHANELTKLQKRKDFEKKNYKIKTARIVFAAELEEQKEIQLAKEKDAAVRKEAEKKRKQEQEMELLKNELFGSDRTIWFRAFEKSLKSDDPQKQNLAIASFLNINKVINGILLYKRHKDDTIGSIGLTISKFDSTTYQYTGIVEVLYHKRARKFIGKFYGSLQGTTIYVYGFYYREDRKDRVRKGSFSVNPFSFSAQLNKERLMEGNWIGSLDRSHKRTVSIIINLFENMKNI